MGLTPFKDGATVFETPVRRRALILYHFTSAAHLRGIHQYGLTVGDVVTDIAGFKGKVGVWLTTSPTPEGQGLGGTMVDKSEFRLTVDVPENNLLRRWSNWARENLSQETRVALDSGDIERPDDFFVYFGWLPTDRILDVTSAFTGRAEMDWGRERPQSHLAPGVPFRKRYDWQKRTLRKVHEVVTLMTAEPVGGLH